jgi:DNA-binding NarL/FixJ family response regulator
MANRTKGEEMNRMMEYLPQQPADFAIAVEKCELELSLIWQELLRGDSTVVDTFFAGSRCGLILRDAGDLRERALARQQHLAELVLSGVSQNFMAIDLNLAPSTVATNLRQALGSMGVAGLPSRVHPVLMLAALAARQQLSVSASMHSISTPGIQMRVVSVSRPGHRAAAFLPAAELEVASKLVEGYSYAYIAKVRKTSVRTIANQLAAVFRRLDVSGRSELILKLFALDGTLPANSLQGSHADRPPKEGGSRRALSVPS